MNSQLNNGSDSNVLNSITLQFSFLNMYDKTTGRNSLSVLLMEH